MSLDDDPRQTRQPPQRYYGKYAGKVIDNSPPDSGVHRGQVMVRIHGILEEKVKPVVLEAFEEERDASMVRTHGILEEKSKPVVPGALEGKRDASDSQPIEILAAPAFLPGFFFIPEIGAPVWVEFVAGDINFPIWTGVWYPNDATPKTAEGDAPTRDQKVIRTRSGHVLQLDDTDGGEKIVIKDEANKSTITLDASGIKIDASASGGSVTLTFGQTTLTLKEDSIEIEQGGTNSIKLSASGVAISAKAGTTITDASGDPRPALLAPILDWLLGHQHVGNMGAPTPLFPTDMAVLNALKYTTGVSKVG
jgi:hypothetical protein